MEYQVAIKETLMRVIKINAESAEEAERKVRELYHKEEIVLDWSDFSSVEYMTSSTMNGRGSTVRS